MFTISKEIVFEGPGVHTGTTTRLHLYPSGEGKILLNSVNSPSPPFSLADCEFEARGGTVLKKNGFSLRTVEHLLATLAALKITSLLIVGEGSEVPILDGSARHFVEKLIAERSPIFKREKTYKIVKPLEIQETLAWVKAEPAENWEIEYGIDYDHPLIGEQILEIRVTEEVFIEQVAPARTFGFLRDVEELRKRGLAKGSSLENTIVLDDAKIVNPPLRFPDEFVRHKILDFIGDLALMAGSWQGRFSAYRAGHSLHQKLVKFLKSHQDCWICD